MALWNVYKMERRRPGGNRELVELGRVRAQHQPDALRRAWEKWPGRLDPTQTQAGFHVRPYTTDRHSIGRERAPIRRRKPK